MGGVGGGGGGGGGVYNLTLNITSMVEEAKGSALMKDSLRGTVLEVKKEQDWRGRGRGGEGNGRRAH